MKAVIQEKALKVTEMVSNLKDAKSFLIFEYLGLSAKSAASLRRTLHDHNAKMYIAKNNIFIRALKDAGFSDMSAIKGPCAMIIAKGDEIIPFKEVDKLMKDFKFIHYTNGFLNGSVVGIDKLSTIASLPSRDGLLSMLCSVLTAPIRNFAYGLKSVADSKK
ncbi:MAG: 50S ribosomal protein L10 [Mycoplasmoidaceae bacterium]|nr:MAG: 50S ribosomal protein L10 [Mycoplasmoidaceae bacterium]